MRYYSKTTGSTYLTGINDQAMPDDVVSITEQRFLEVLANPTPGKIRSHDADGLPILIDPPAYVPTADELCQRIDTTADAARRAVAGEPLRAVEYDRSRIEAEQFAAAGYQGDVPPMVAAWAISGRTPQQAAESILAEAAEYTNALIQLRTIRLQAKELIRAAMASGEVEQAKQIVTETVAAIQSAVAGVGNNA